jgi:hypothetical protein
MNRTDRGNAVRSFLFRQGNAIADYHTNPVWFSRTLIFA